MQPEIPDNAADERSARKKWREAWDGKTPVLTRGECMALDELLAEEGDFDSQVYLAHATTPPNPAAPGTYLLRLSDEGRALLTRWRKEFSVVVNIEDNHDVDIREEVREAVNMVLSRHGLRGSADIVERAAPRVVVTVDAGMASIAVDGTIDVLHIDLDGRGDDDVDEAYIDRALAFERRTGVSEDVDKAVREAREGLGRYADGLSL